MLAQLGDIKFELITQFNGLTENSSYNYAEHERIDDKPLLQFLGANLQELTIKLNFHTFFCSPEEEIKRLKEAAGAGTALKYIKGNGEYVGVFVIEEIGSSTEQTSNDGFLVSIQIEIRLKEYTGEIPEDNEQEKGFRKR